jgi:hypothetical protein
VIFFSASDAARCVARHGVRHGVRSQSVPIALAVEVSIPVVFG